MYTAPTPQFLLYPKRKNSIEPTAAIYARVIFEKKVHEKSMNVTCRYEQWDGENGVIRSAPVETFQLKQSFEEFKQKVMGAYYMLRQQSVEFILQDILDLATGHRKAGVLSFVQCFNDVISRMQKSRGTDGNSATNIQKHKRCLDHFNRFLQSCHKSSDIPFSRINRSFIDDLATHLRTEGECSHNTAMKYMQIVKKVYRVGMDNGWVRVNAFANFKFKIKIVERSCLTEEELRCLLKAKLNMKRLEFVKDLFIFSCFTGLAYIDVKELRKENILTSNGRTWIKSKRVKTGMESLIPLLQPARQIIDKYCPGWNQLQNDQQIFQIISNQKMNAYLKEIATICRIDKEITFHLARHTFATTVTLCNDIPMETVSKMLGHSRITMTQHYSKVIDSKIARDTSKLMSKYK